MNLTKLEEILEGEFSFRTKQIFQFLFRDLNDNWDNATTLSKDLRDKLKQECKLEIDGRISESRISESRKALITLEDDEKIETVLMQHRGGRNTVCVSSQVGCPLGCYFCATGKMGFRRNLTYWEIVEQVLFFSRILKKENSRVTNIVFMGMGEPFLNYDNVIMAVKVLNNPFGFNLGARHFSISTSGITEGIRKLAEEDIQVNLAISLHASNDSLRSKLMPINIKYHLKDVMRAVKFYVEKTNRKVMFEYLMINDTNDFKEQAYELIKLLDNPLYFVNLINYNPTGIFKPSTTEKIKLFKDILIKNGLQATERYRFGDDIDAACGQLATRANRKR